MAVFRALILLGLLAAAGSFAAYAVTSEPRFRRFGTLVLAWTLLAAFGFFAVLIVERLF